MSATTIPGFQGFNFLGCKIALLSEPVKTEPLLFFVTAWNFIS